MNGNCLEEIRRDFLYDLLDPHFAEINFLADSSKKIHLSLEELI